MVRDLVRKLKNLRVEAVPFDPSSLGDEVALRTQWTPARGGGANFQTHHLVEADFQRMEFRATRGMVLFAGLFVAVGLGAAAGALVVGSDDFGGALFVAFIGLVFGGVGVTMLKYSLAPIVFDKGRGEYWKGRAPSEALNRHSLKHFTELDRIRALQIVKERCTSKNSSYYSYELNLVLEDGSRHNVVDHGNLERLRQDARRLAAFLQKPVWDGT